jgi:predicted metallo-beta-lactamase superfamily hydrolase
MNDHIKPSLRSQKAPNHYILHVGTNDLSSSQSAEGIANGIVNLAAVLKKEIHDVTVSNIIIRNDKWKEKANDVNNNLKNICMEKNIYLLEHSTITQKHLNKSRIHLNKTGSDILGKSFSKAILNIFS